MKFRSNWQIYSTSFMTSVFPSVLKTAKVVPVFKKDSKLDYSNYHLISLLSNKRLYTFLNNTNTIYNLQFGFRQQYSTSHALIDITENIRKAIDDGNMGFVEITMGFMEFQIISLNLIFLIIVTMYP